MKKIIEGIRYDTDKAKEIGHCEYGCYPGNGDFSFWFASLYQTSNGRFFLTGEGGAMTQFADRCREGSVLCGGQNLIPLTNREALSWAETYLTTDIVEEHFKDMDEDA